MPYFTILKIPFCAKGASREVPKKSPLCAKGAPAKPPKKGSLVQRELPRSPQKKAPLCKGSSRGAGEGLSKQNCRLQVI